MDPLCECMPCMHLPRQAEVNEGGAQSIHRGRGGRSGLCGQGTLVGKFTPTAPNDSQWLPMAPNDSRQLPTTTNTRCCWLPMTPTDFQRLPSRELYSPTILPGQRTGRMRGGGQGRVQTTRPHPARGAVDGIVGLEQAQPTVKGRDDGHRIGGVKVQSVEQSE